MIYVHPAWQRQGIGSALLNQIYNSDFLDGLHGVLALINKDNVHQHRLLERMGYTCKGKLTEVGSKFGRYHSLLIYQKSLSRT